MTTTHRRRGGEKLKAGKTKCTDATCGKKKKSSWRVAKSNTATSHFSSPPRILTSNDYTRRFTLFPLQCGPSRRPPAGEPRGGRKERPPPPGLTDSRYRHFCAERPGLSPGLPSQLPGGRDVRFLPSPQLETVDLRPGFRRRTA